MTIQGDPTPPGAGPPDPPFPRRTVLGLDVCVAGRDEAVAFVARRVADRQRTLVAFANTNLINQARAAGFTEQLSRDFVLFNDGVGLNLVSRIVTGHTFSDNLNGTDLTAAVLDAVPPGTRVFLYGARPEVLERASSALGERYGIVVCGTADGYLGEAERARLPERIDAARPDLVLVALGNPRQERWMADNAQVVTAPVLIGVGAFLDFSADAVPRAPHWMRTLRLEWSYRLIKEPGRLWRRYTVDIGTLVVAAVRQRLSDRKGSTG